MRLEKAANSPTSFCFEARSITCCGVRKGMLGSDSLLRSPEKVIREFTKRLSHMRMILEAC